MKIPGMSAALFALFASVATAQSPQTGQQQSAQATLRRAIAMYGSAQTVSARFEQTISNPLTDRSVQTTGELLRRRPNLLAITFAGATPDRIVADGSDLWLYLPSSAPGQVIKVPAAGQTGVLIDPLGQVLAAPADRFSVSSAGTAVVGGHSTHAVQLTPKSGDQLFTSATIWVDDADSSVRKIMTTEPSGLVRTVTITQFRKNVAIPRSSFHFTVPPDTRVIDRRSIAGG